MPRYTVRLPFASRRESLAYETALRERLPASVVERAAQLHALHFLQTAGPEAHRAWQEDSETTGAQMQSQSQSQAQAQASSWDTRAEELTSSLQADWGTGGSGGVRRGSAAEANGGARRAEPNGTSIGAAHAAPLPHLVGVTSNGRPAQAQPNGSGFHRAEPNRNVNGDAHPGHTGAGYLQDGCTPGGLTGNGHAGYTEVGYTQGGDGYTQGGPISGAKQAGLGRWEFVGPNGDRVFAGKDSRAAQMVGEHFSRVLELFLLYAQAMAGAPVRRHWRTPPAGGATEASSAGEPSGQEASSGTMHCFLVPQGHNPPALGSGMVSCLYILHRPDGWFYVGEV